MPRLQHEARDLFETPTGSEINGKNIALIVFVAIVPVIVVAAAVSWLLCCYGRRKKDKANADVATGAVADTNADVNASAGPGWKPSPTADSTSRHPEPVLHRNDSVTSGSSGSGERTSEKTPTLPQGFV